MALPVLTPYAVRGTSCYRNAASGDRLARTTALPAATAYTACGWFIQRANTSNYAGLLTLETASGEVGALTYDANGTSLGISNGASVNTFATSPSLGRSFFAAVSMDGSTVTGYWRHSDSSTLTSTTIGQGSGSPLTNACIGGFAVDSSLFFNGNVWNVRAWDAVLTPLELMREANAAFLVRTTNVHALWLLEGTLDQLTFDRSGNGRHLTRTGSGRVEPFAFPGSLLAPLPVDVVVRAPPGGGITATVNQAIETDLAHPMARVKARVVSQVVESDTSQTFARRKVKGLAQASETDAAQTVTRAKARVAAQVAEADLAQPITRAGRIVNQAIETDIAQPIGKSKRRQVSQIVETDTAQPVLRLKRRVVGLVLELDAAQALARAKRRAVGQAIETDLTQAIAWAPKRRLVAQVAEADSAMQIVPALSSAPTTTGPLRIGPARARDSAERIGRSATSASTLRIG